MIFEIYKEDRIKGMIRQLTSFFSITGNSNIGNNVRLHRYTYSIRG